MSKDRKPFFSECFNKEKLVKWKEKITKWLTKKRIIVLSALSLVIVLGAAALIVWLCSDTECTSHKDENGDLICDLCGEALEQTKEPEEPKDESCAECSDTDGDGLCDVCGNEIEEPEEPKDESCAECSDTDGDGLCDVCGKEIEEPEEPSPELPSEPECEQHTDENYDGACDLCQGEMKDAIRLVSLGKSNYSFVIGGGIDGNARLAINSLQKKISALGVKIDTYNVKDKESEYEIIFGDALGRGEEYFIDSHDYGMKGYAVSIIDKKIIVTGGSGASLVTAINALGSEIFGIKESTVRLVNRVAYPTQSIAVIQDDYQVNKITLFDKDIRDYSIAYDKKCSEALFAANMLQTLLYEKTGYWLPVEEKENAEKAIFINLLEKTDGDGFYATFEDGRITFDVEYTTSIKKEITAFFEDTLSKTSGTLAFDGDDSFTRNVRDVFYKDFGTVGDGITNDADAIFAAHQYAYQGGHKKIIAEAGKTYYIGYLAQEIPIICDVDWTDAKFIIDDSIINVGTNVPTNAIFNIESLYSSKSITAANSDAITRINEEGGIDKDKITVFDLGLGYPAMIRVYNSTHKNYIRYGPNKNSGMSQCEIIIVDENGNIDESTPFLFDYEKITSVTVYRIEDEPITVRGGEFTTVANKAGLSNSFFRGINVSRSNVTVTGLRHYVVGEGEKGAPYSAFLQTSSAYNVMISDCVFTAHKTYYNSNGVGSGTYDIGAKYSVKVTWKNCTQSNFYRDNGSYNSSVWGIMGSNVSKNLVYEGCLLNRFDAHTGVVNAAIKNTTIKHIRIVGGGTFLLENSHVYNTTLISLREDYGGFWHGDVIIKNITVHAGGAVSLFNNTWYNHDFGYVTALPKSITVDGLTLVGTSTVRLFSTSFAASTDKILKDEFVNETSGETTPNVNKTLPTESVILKNITDGINFILPTEYEFFKDMKVTQE